MLKAIVGLNWGDEGKGRMVDNLSAEADYTVRYHGGSNAGHTIHTDQGKFKLHSLPSSVLHPTVTGVLGPGMTVDVEGFLAEFEALREHGVTADRLLVADAASVCFPFHRDLDGAEEERLSDGRYGSTRRGISPAYGDRVMKKTLLVRELFDRENLPARLAAVLDWANERIVRIYGGAPLSLDEVTRWAADVAARLEPHVVDATALLGKALDDGATVIAEGQLGALKDLYYGIYPFTTSSTCLAGHAPVGIGVPWARVDRTIGVTKAFSSCVGAGPFVTEFDEERADRLRRQWGEYGSTTNRPRRLGAFDAVATRYGVRVQGADEVAITNLDQLSGTGELDLCVAYERAGRTVREFSPRPAELAASTPVHETLSGWDEDISGVRTYEQLPAGAREYVEAIQELLGVPVRHVSVGSHRDALIEIK
ncbi:adenylosuccinate synthase [Streptomyces kaniharaensis]|uniref:Adenylosuccinate synthetase n=1 Tax=Streptomyces kaniharaensis TaxID=212423 RepID=A0A1S6Q5K4_9ACTN|nr:adenylosuccinate synthase [Streptomyces kaniharaensis]AQV09460.1 ForA [Streptomyces kaniharaensis]AVW82949.1 adenylosuccinate synthetase [Streptomyces kaniharaensis]MQS11304.1 adenylosuccinate synthase [Streptomyces kaniharaensis]QTK22488.1 adenylosuccinate synthetase [Streptomyces kaniharaensis]